MRYWQHHLDRKQVWAERHPGKYLNPIGLFGDECKYTEANDKIVVMHLNSVIQDRCNAGRKHANF